MNIKLGPPIQGSAGVERIKELEDALRTIGGWALAGTGEKDFMEIYRKVKSVLPDSTAQLCQHVWVDSPDVSDIHCIKCFAPQCLTCNGRGEVGGFDHGEGGYRSEPCPACSARAKACES